MLFQVGGDGSRPTFFEMDASDKLQQSLKAAVLYALGVFAQRWPSLHKVLDYGDETTGVLLLFLEAHSLRTLDASFGEGLYGLRRTSAAVEPKSNHNDSLQRTTTGLTPRQRVSSLFFLVVVPYIRSKLQTLYITQTRASRPSFLQEDDVNAEEFSFDGVDPYFENESEPFGGSSNPTLSSQFKKLALSAFTRGFPFIHALFEGSTFLWQLTYLLDATQFYSPFLQCIGLVVRRSSQQELSDSTKIVNDRRKREYSRLPGPQPLKIIQRGLLQVVYTFMDYAQAGLVASVFLFKMLEWWYQTGESKILAPVTYPPPPPPPQPKVATGGLSLPANRHLCPLCQQHRTNPALAVVSGFVFCYPCIFNYVTQYERCPITLVPSTVDDIRKLYHNT